MKKYFFSFLFYLSIANCLLSTVNCYGQKDKIDSLLNVLKTTKADTTKVKIFNNLFLEFEFVDDVKAKEYLNKALELSQKMGYKKGLADTYNNFGYFEEDKSNYSKAIFYYHASLKISEKIHDKSGVANSYNNIGNVYDNQGNYPEALKNHFASLKISEEIKDKKGVAASYNNIGIIYRAQRNYSAALSNCFASLKLKEELGDKKGVAYSYNNIGLTYYDEGNYPAALKNLLISLKIGSAIDNKRGLAQSYNNIGSVYQHLSNYSEALKYHFAALKIKKEIGDKAGIVSSNGNIGNVLLAQKKYDLGRKYLDKAKKLAMNIGYREFVKEAYNSLAKLDSATGNYKGAFENNKLYILYRDSLDNEETRKKTIQSQMTYDFEKKEAVANAEHKKELENQNILAEEKSRKQKIVLTLVSCFLLLVLVFSGFVFRSLRITRKQKDVIEIQKSIVEMQKLEVEQQKLIVEEHQKEIIDSITYARRIQCALLPTEKYIERNLQRMKK